VTSADGYSIHPDVLTAPEVDRLVSALGTVRERSRAGARHLMTNPVINQLAGDARLLALARLALDGPAIPYRATLFDKSPRSNWLVVWHQDTALALRTRVETPGWGPWSTKAGVLYAHAPASALQTIAALRIHLDDSKRENGPLRVLPGTHTRGVLTDQEIAELTSRIDAEDCIVGRGGVVCMRPLVVHSSSKSVSNAPRRVLHLEYAQSLQLGGGLQLQVA
jgi:ectoine hydroxylase-related dioxygenase (phytanoyl-CoA dioxygenase family)